jgi:hypothetical protein
MDLRPYYGWIVFFHVAGVLLFVLFHGASVAVALTLRREREPARIRAYLQLSNAFQGPFYGGYSLLFLAGILAGLVGGWWTNGRLWIWLSLVLFIAITVAMYALPLRYFETLRTAVGIQTERQARAGAPPPTPVSEAELEGLLRSPVPGQTAVIGVGGLLLIAWLMVVKPF